MTTKFAEDMAAVKDYSIVLSAIAEDLHSELEDAINASWGHKDSKMVFDTIKHRIASFYSLVVKMENWSAGVIACAQEQISDDDKNKALRLVGDTQYCIGTVRYFYHDYSTEGKIFHLQEIEYKNIEQAVSNLRAIKEILESLNS